jgi:adenylate cyclase
MGVEIERKFLVEGDSWRDEATSAEPIDQGYLRSDDATVRVRTIGERGFITLKGRTSGVTRSEFEYEIPFEDAVKMLDEFCGDRRLTKTRHTVFVGDHEWVVDVFHGRHDGLVLAEIELDSEDESFDMPDWVGPEVSGDPAYYNANLVR